MASRSGSRTIRYGAGGNPESVTETAPEVGGVYQASLPAGNRLNDQVDAATKGGLLGPLLAQMLGENAIRYSGPGIGSQDYAKQTMRDALMREGSPIGNARDNMRPAGPAGPSRGAGYNMGAPSGPSEQFQLNKAHKEQMYQQDQAYNQKARGAALDFNYQQKGANMKSKLALQLLHGILGGRGGLNGPRVTTEDSQGIGERGGVSVPVSLHSTQSVKPGGSDRAQMMAQLLQAITGMI